MQAAQRDANIENGVASWPRRALLELSTWITRYIALECGEPAGELWKDARACRLRGLDPILGGECS